MTSSIELLVRIPDERTCAFLLSCLLCSMLLLSCDARPPDMSISDIGPAEEGTVASLDGLVTSLFRYDSGAESLVLADISDGATAKIICSPGGKEMPSLYLSVGDEVRVTGELSFEGERATVFCDSDEVTLLRKARYVLEVCVLCTNWQLFDGDRFNVTGVLETAERGSGYILQDTARSCSIAARLSAWDAPVPVGVPVVVDCTMVLDKNTMAFVLVIWSAEPIH